MLNVNWAAPITETVLEKFPLGKQISLGVVCCGYNFPSTWVSEVLKPKKAFAREMLSRVWLGDPIAGRCVCLPAPTHPLLLGELALPEAVTGGNKEPLPWSGIQSIFEWQRETPLGA